MREAQTVPPDNLSERGGGRRVGAPTSYEDLIRPKMSISSGGSSPLVRRACRWGMGAAAVWLLTTLSRYLERHNPPPRSLQDGTADPAQSEGREL